MNDADIPNSGDLAELFSLAIDLDELGRVAMVSVLHKSNPGLAAQLERVLRADSDAGAFLERPLTSPLVSQILAVGDVVENFRVESCIASGSLGTVYRAVQDHPRRVVALKVLHYALPSNNMVARFRQEIRTLARLSHVGIVPLFAAGVIDPESRVLPWFAMELVPEAENIRSWSVGKPLEQCVKAIAEVCSAVHYAHMKQVIHRDLKPANILVGADGKPRVIDFGIATSTGATATHASQLASLTAEGSILGTLAYMSAEQLENAASVDARTDVYSLGVVLYELCTGRLPFQLGSVPIQAMRAIALDTPIDPIIAAPTITRLRGDLSAIILKAIDRNPDRRYSSAFEFATDLEHWLLGEPVIARHPAIAERMIRTIRRRPVVSALVGMSVLALIAVAVTSVLGARHAYSEAMRAQRYIEGLVVMVECPEVVGMGREARVVSIADSGARLLDASTLSPDMEADGRMISGRLYEALGLYPESQIQYKRASALRSAWYGSTHLETLETMATLARVSVRIREFQFGSQKRDDPESMSLIAKSVEDLVGNLGWTDPRTLDALKWSLPALSAEQLAHFVDELANVEISNPVRAALYCKVLTQLIKGGGTSWKDGDRTILKVALTSLAQSATLSDTAAVSSAAELACQLVWANDEEAAAQVVAIIESAVRNPALSEELCKARNLVAVALRSLGRLEDALSLYELTVSASRPTTSNGRAFRYESTYSGSQILVDLSRSSDARVLLEQIDFDKGDDSDSLDVKIWRTITTAAYARVLARCGDRERAEQLASRARQLETIIPPLSTGFKWTFDRDIREAEGGPLVAPAP